MASDSGRTASKLAALIRTGPNGVEAAALGFAGLAALAVPILTAPPAFAAAFGVYTLVGLIALGPKSPARLARPFGTANGMTLARAAAAALLAGIAAEIVWGPAVADQVAVWTAVAIAVLALVSDAIDGMLARRAGRADAYGARFDMEVDALLMLVLTLLLWSAGKTGAWIILLGSLRYAFLGAGYLWPPLRRPLPPSRRRRVVCAAQGIGLTLALAPVILPPVSAAIAAATFVLVAISFAIDVVWLSRSGRGRA